MPQTRHPSPEIGKWGYFHFVVDLLVMGTFTFLKSTLTTSYHDGLYVILVLIYLVRFGKRVAISFAVMVSAIIIYVCLCKHFEHNISHFILLGTMLAVIYFVGNILDLEKSLREKLRYLSTHDQLTGVYNFRYFQEQLVHELERTHRYQRPLSLVIFDIDDFKKYNDSFGHDAGNLVLQEVAKLITEQIRNTDIVARYGGEEFVLIMPETDKAGAVTVTERIRQTISSHDFPHRQVTLSAGVAEYPAEAQDAQELFTKADNLLYQAKSSGKNRTCH